MEKIRSEVSENSNVLLSYSLKSEDDVFDDMTD